VSYLGQQVLAVVPARAGSTGIRGKNLRPVAGTPLVETAGRVAAQLDWIDYAVLSTDGVEIARAGERAGLRVPFMRPDALATDTAVAIDVWRHAWTACEQHVGCRFDLSILLEPTSPMRTPQDVERTVEMMLKGGYDSAATVSPIPAKFSAERAVNLSSQGALSLNADPDLANGPRQAIPIRYSRNGICYVVTREALLERGLILGEHCLGVVIERPVINIDEPHELAFADWWLSQEKR
jgi:CMP-N-acetylneuraminic acid synthetase